MAAILGHIWLRAAVLLQKSTSQLMNGSVSATLLQTVPIVTEPFVSNGGPLNQSQSGLRAVKVASSLQHRPRPSVRSQTSPSCSAPPATALSHRRVVSSGGVVRRMEEKSVSMHYHVHTISVRSVVMLLKWSRMIIQSCKKENSFLVQLLVKGKTKSFRMMRNKL